MIRMCQLARIPSVCLEFGALVINLSVAFLATWEAVSESGILAEVELLCLQKFCDTSRVVLAERAA